MVVAAIQCPSIANFRKGLGKRKSSRLGVGWRFGLANTLVLLDCKVRRRFIHASQKSLYIEVVHLCTLLNPELHDSFYPSPLPDVFVALDSKRQFQFGAMARLGNGL